MPGLRASLLFTSFCGLGSGYSVPRPGDQLNGLHTVSMPGGKGVSFGTTGERPELERRTRDWTLESKAGSLDAPCGTTLVRDSLPDCSARSLDIGKRASSVYRENPNDLHGAASDIVILNQEASSGAAPCRAQKGSSKSAFHMVIDTTYTNHPRCCEASEYDGLVHDHATGGQKPWLVRALTTFSNESKGLLHDRPFPYHYEVRPRRPCTAANKCPAVFQIGTTVDSWFLAQSYCKRCGDELGVILVNPKIFSDMQPQDGEQNVGSSTNYLNKFFFPFVDDYLKTHPEVDQDRVHAVALSQGDDTAFRAALLRPDLFSSVLLAGKLLFTEETMKMVQMPEVVSKDRLAKSRLKYIQFNVGEDDSVFKDEVFYPRLKEVVSQFDPKAVTIELHTYPESGHTVWWASWNAFHEMIWTGTKLLGDYSGKIALTCSSNLKDPVQLKRVPSAAAESEGSARRRRRRA